MLTQGGFAWRTTVSHHNLMVSLSSPIAITYTLCAGDADRAGDERQPIVHADL